MGLSVKDGNGANVVLPGYDPAYSAGFAAYTLPTAAPTDVVIFQGSASKIIRVKRISISSLCTTTAGQFRFDLVKRSDAGTAGSATLVAVASAPHDSASAAATAVLSKVATANYTTVGTIVGSPIRVSRPFVTLTTVAPTTVVWDFSSRMDQAPTLRAATEFLCINCAGQTLLTAQTMDMDIEWEEGNV